MNTQRSFSKKHLFWVALIGYYLAVVTYEINRAIKEDINEYPEGMY